MSQRFDLKEMVCTLQHLCDSLYNMLYCVPCFHAVSHIFVVLAVMNTFYADANLDESDFNFCARQTEPHLSAGMKPIRGYVLCAKCKVVVSPKCCQ